MRAILRLWRRSIQTRVVTSTIVLSALVIGLTGWALLNDVAGGLAEHRRDSAIAQAKTGLAAAQDRLNAAVQSDDAAQSSTLTQMVDALAQARASSRLYDLVLEGPLTATGSGPVRSSTDLGADSVPADLDRQVRQGTGTYWRYGELHALRGGGSPVIVVGSTLRAPSNGDRYALYYIFSMSDQQATLDLVRRALLLGGLVMVLMVGGVAWLVSRQVVNPVRLARRIAERFAGGNLEQRMHVRGEDDLARLATSFNQMAANLQSQIRRLEDLSRLQQRFVSDVSHELRTPLTTVQMASDVLHRSRAQFDPQTARATELLHGELERFEALLSDLLDLSRFDAGAANLELSDVDLALVARHAAGNPQLAARRITVELRGADRPAVVQADVRRVDRIVRNLLTNAAKYSGSDRVRISVAANESAVSLSVRDWGVGLRGDENLRVFDRFWRADPARTQGGTGLGLSISREDANLHGGTLRAWGRPGEGSEFVVTLPRRVGLDVEPPIVSELA